MSNHVIIPFPDGTSAVAVYTGPTTGGDREQNDLERLACALSARALAAERERDELAAVVEQLEWCNHSHCPVCDELYDHLHDADCPFESSNHAPILAAVRREAAARGVEQLAELQRLRSRAERNAMRADAIDVESAKSFSFAARS